MYGYVGEFGQGVDGWIGREMDEGGSSEDDIVGNR